MNHTLRSDALYVAIAVIAGAATLPGASQTRAFEGEHLAAADLGVNFIISTQASDGGFGAFGQSLDAIIALRSVGIDPATAISGTQSTVDFFVENVSESEESVGLAAKAVLAATALGLDPNAVAGTDLVSAVESSLDPVTGLYGADAFTQSTAILGLACIGSDVPAVALNALREQVLEDGGWGFGGASDPDTTAIAAQALLAAAGETGLSSHVDGAMAYFAATQLADGGWGFAESNTSSTAFVVQAILAAGGDPSDSAYAKPGGDPIAYLLSQQGSDGSFAGFDPAFATNQVVPALAGSSFCDAPGVAIERSAPTPPPAGTGLAPSPSSSHSWMIQLGLLLILAAAATGLASFRR